MTIPVEQSTKIFISLAAASWFVVVMLAVLLRSWLSRAVGEIKRKSVERQLVSAAACLVTVHVCATKPQTNDTDGVDAPIYGLMSAYVHPEIGGLTGDGAAYSVTNVFFSHFGKTGNVVSAGITIGENYIGWGDVIRIYVTDNLEHPVWTNGYERQLEDETSLAVQFDMSQFPTSYLHHAYFGLDYPQDSDGDGINDGDERYRYHSNPEKYDTDDDGLGDGDELRIGSSLISVDSDGDGLSDSEETGGAIVMPCSSMMWLNTSSCTELSLSSDIWNVQIPGGVKLAGSIYTNCEVNMAGRLSFGGGAVTVDACGRMVYSDGSWASKVLCGTVIEGGVEYFVAECRNISTDAAGAAKMSCQIAIPKSEPNVVYVSYQRVDEGIKRPRYEFGVICSNMVSPFDTQSEYTILPPVGYRKPVANTTIKYIIGLGSDPTVYNRYEEPALPPTSNSNAYYTVDIVAEDHAHIVFSGDGPSDLPDPDFWVLPGDTNRVKLLMGKSYVANASAAITCTGASDSEVVVSNVSEHAISFVRPVRVIALEGNGLGYSTRVIPSNLNGTFIWTNSCCSITGSGNEFWYVHTGGCDCNGCYAAGVYRYEGYSLSCLGGYCDCPRYRDEWPHLQEDEGPYAADISVSFSAPAVIFEDAYNNNPTSTVPRRSTQTSLSCVVHGGESGGTVSFSIVNASKIDSVEGYLPDSIFVPPMQKLEFDVCYEGNEPSGSVDDIVVTGTFTPRSGGNALADSDTLTSIRLTMTAVYEAPENPCTNRHVYGVGEKVRFEVTPVIAGERIVVVKADARDLMTPYDTFDGATDIIVSNENLYRCPATDTVPDITLQYGGVEYCPEMMIVEPQLVVTREATGSGIFWPGDVCMGILATRNYIGPFHVSFRGVKMFEVPCTNAIPPVGYFATTNYTGMRTHLSSQAGWVSTPDENNYWMTDEAGRTEPYPNWSAGMLIWKIPIGWKRFQYEGDDSVCADKPDYSNHMREDTRPLLIGNREDAYLQVFNIDASGTSSVEKFGYKLERSRSSLCGVVTKIEE